MQPPNGCTTFLPFSFFSSLRKRWDQSCSLCKYNGSSQTGRCCRPIEWSSRAKRLCAHFAKWYGNLREIARRRAQANCNCSDCREKTGKRDGAKKEKERATREGSEKEPKANIFACRMMRYKLGSKLQTIWSICFFLLFVFFLQVSVWEKRREKERWKETAECAVGPTAASVALGTTINAKCKATHRQTRAQLTPQERKCSGEIEIMENINTLWEREREREQTKWRL